jgi:hypothetical protein
MAVLTKKQRAHSKMLLPGKDMFPVPDKEHAEKAAQLAPRALKAGSITRTEENKVVRDAHKILGLKHRPLAGKKWR